ncbi:MAG TPA: RagB/SusD family nutrient uptake outer membrane protein [Lentimicrobium sp.]|nr:RagB/SusD family nutrient uptake outer membrane protein [Lentimicrobium sp.]
MKANKWIYMLLIFALFSFSSCKDYLEFPPEGTIPAEGFFETQEHAEQSVNSIYAHLRGWEMVSFAYIIMQEVTSDNSQKGSVTGDASFINDYDNFTFTPSQFVIKDYWAGRYRGINLCNQSITNIPAITMDEGLKSRLIAEAKFLRALIYFDLVRAYGDIPTPTQVPVGPEINFRTPKDQVYSLIESDLLDAISVLPDSYDNANKGRATSGAAKGLLSKVYLYMERYADAERLAGEVISSGKYALLPDFYDVFRVPAENGPESLFEIQAQQVEGNDGVSFCQHAEVQSVRGQWGWGFNIPTDDLAAAFDAAGDTERKAATILYKGDVTPDGDFIIGVNALEGVSTPRYNAKAYFPSSQQLVGPYGSGQNIRVLRYSEILLIQAEARVRQGNSSGAAAPLNEVRSRAGLAAINSPTLDDILKERRLELAMEGDRFFDLVRTGQAASVLASKGFTAGKNELFPIPQELIDLSEGNLTQNQGY